jgi:transcriptional regulator with XRE-family HTH domain
MSQPRTLDVLLSDFFTLLRAVGKRVQHDRQAADLTGAELAHQTGLTVETIHDLEDGKTTELTAWLRLLNHPAMRRIPEYILQEATKLRLGPNGVGKQ